ncbi:MAG TPA: hypothetical protein PLQ56_10090 [Aggregatilineales bacterium]|nr:hypothetical protein [Aggregatilineales bacterium]
MSFFRRPSNTNAVVAIFLLVTLAIFAGPNLLPNLVATIFPNGGESIPCAWLRSGIERAEHQSLIGRGARADQLEIRVRSTSLPSTADGRLLITIVLTNDSLGTVAIAYSPTGVRFGDDGLTSGMGVVFNSTARLPAGGSQNAPVPESEIRLLGPRQSCIHRIELAPNQYPDPTIGTGSATVKAYYRNTNPGVAQVVTANTSQIFTTQGLWTGLVESVAVPIPLAGTS